MNWWIVNTWLDRKLARHCRPDRPGDPGKSWLACKCASSTGTYRQHIHQSEDEWHIFLPITVKLQQIHQSEKELHIFLPITGKLQQIHQLDEELYTVFFLPITVKLHESNNPMPRYTFFCQSDERERMASFSQFLDLQHIMYISSNPGIYLPKFIIHTLTHRVKHHRGTKPCHLL